MNIYTSNATLPIKMMSDSILGKTTPIDDTIPNCKVKFIESKTLSGAEKKANAFMVGKYVLSLDIIPAGLNYIVKILYF